MTVTVIRRALWLVAAVALGSATVAFWYWLPLQLIVSAGLFVVLIPIDMVLHREEIERGQRSPFGPVRKFGISEDALHRDLPYQSERARLAAEQSYRTRFTTGVPSVPWWRRMYRRLTPWWSAPVMIFAAVVLGGLLAPPPAHALSMTRQYTVSVVWTGQPTCIEAWEPAGGDTASPFALCSVNQYWSATYTVPGPGHWVGVDPEMSGADTMSCSIVSGTNVLYSDFAVKGDGSEVTCLTRW